MFEATKQSNRNADHKALHETYGIALWKVDKQKRGINSGGNLGAVDISLSSETDDQNNSGEDSDSSEDGMQVIRDDSLRLEQVSPPSFPKENRFLAGLMKSPPKLQLEEHSRPALCQNSDTTTQETTPSPSHPLATYALTRQTQ